MKLQTVGENACDVEVSNISKHGLWLFVRGDKFFLDYKKFPWFKEAVVAAILNVELPHPDHIYWPELDVDLELDAIKSPDKYPLIYR